VRLAPFVPTDLGWQHHLEERGSDLASSTRQGSQFVAYAPEKRDRDSCSQEEELEEDM
jgi:hypothetical protein